LPAQDQIVSRRAGSPGQQSGTGGNSQDQGTSGIAGHSGHRGSCLVQGRAGLGPGRLVVPGLARRVRAGWRRL